MTSGDMSVLTVEIGKLQLFPGDILVIRLPDGWGVDRIQQFDEYLHALDKLPVGVKTLFLPMCAEIGVLCPALTRSQLH